MPFSKGDVFAGIGNGRWNHFDASGTLLATLDDGHIGNVGGFEPAHATTGMCFDPAGDMYAMNFANNSMAKFDKAGSLVADAVGTFDSNPEACLVAGGNAIYASEVTGSGDILKLDLGGAEVARYDVGRSDWIDLAADGCTMLYTDEGRAIHRFDVCANAAMADFAVLPSGGLFALRILPDGTVLAAATSAVKQFDKSGTEIGSYTALGENKLFALNIDPDGTHFWTGGLIGSNIYKFAISPIGAPVLSFSPQVEAGGGTGLAGLAVFGEVVVSQATPSPAVATPSAAASPKPTPTPPPVDQPVTPGSDLSFVWLGLVALVVVVLVLLLLFTRRRRRRSTGQ